MAIMTHPAPTVLVGAPVHNRAWILPAYLEALARLDYPADRLSFAFVVNDSTDESLAILRRFQSRGGYRRIEVVELRTGLPPDRRWRRAELGVYRRLALARNRLLAMLRDERFLFSVDTDILVPPDALARLLANDRDVCAALVYNDARNLYPNAMCDVGGRLVHCFHFPPDRPFRVAVTGAVYLLSARVCRVARYDDHPLGEDVPFCQAARAVGFELWLDPRVRCRHVMHPSWLTADPSASPPAPVKPAPGPTPPGWSGPSAAPPPGP
ncbi:MAG: glycosyltransferase family 2 protein [Clostridia bacterium]|nr:glycosyltransferase family 2 protein [Clostridia bacterium]